MYTAPTKFIRFKKFLHSYVGLGIIYDNINLFTKRQKLTKMISLIFSYFKSISKKNAPHCSGLSFLISKTTFDIASYRQQPSPLPYSIGIWPARNSRLTQRETNHCIARCASVLAWSYLAGRSPEQLVLDLFAQHQRFALNAVIG